MKRLLATAVFLLEAALGVKIYETSQLHQRGTCNIDIVRAEDMTPALFKERYYLQKPLLITDLNGLERQEHFQSQKVVGVDWDLWTGESLLKNYGAEQVMVGSSSTIVKTRGTGHLQAPFGAVLTAMMHPENGTDEDLVDVYAFDRNSRLLLKHPELTRGLQEMTRFLFGDLAPGEKRDAEEESHLLSVFNWYLSVGGRGSGTHFHRHGNAWLLTFEGEKQWYIWDSRNGSPPLAHDSDLPATEWAESWFPKLTAEERERLFMCKQGKGELVYVPENFWHATRNTKAGPTVAVGGQDLRYFVTMRDADKRLFSMQDGGESALTQLLAGMLSAEVEGSRIPSSFGEVYGWLANAYRWQLSQHQRQQEFDDPYQQSDDGRLQLDEAAVQALMEKEVEAQMMQTEILKRRSCEALDRLAGSVMKAGRPKEAVIYAREALSLCSMEPKFWDTLHAVLQKCVSLEGGLNKTMVREAENAAATIQHLQDTVLSYSVLPVVDELTARYKERERQEREKEQNEALCSDTPRAKNRITIHP